MAAAIELCLSELASSETQTDQSRDVWRPKSVSRTAFGERCPKTGIFWSTFHSWSFRSDSHGLKQLSCETFVKTSRPEGPQCESTQARKRTPSLLATILGLPLLTHVTLSHNRNDEDVSTSLYPGGASPANSWTSVGRT
ncbi:hypothetical protein ZHAS_00013685 [Anopheles sinensis]|uniref:Uncharacterized protein n=1 Tax=Anopheles sinensis TaxID=74873 RepID=A0A084W6H9_ANOSI|nr:hypothetical protein ZHAS_00013685 [Anopheles sinensis]